MALLSTLRWLPIALKIKAKTLTWSTSHVPAPADLPNLVLCHSAPELPALAMQHLQFLILATLFPTSVSLHMLVPLLGMNPLPPLFAWSISAPQVSLPWGTFLDLPDPEDSS